MNSRNRKGVLNFSEAKANKNASVAIKGQRNVAPIISERYIGKQLIDSRISRKAIRGKYAAIQRDNRWM